MGLSATRRISGRAAVSVPLLAQSEAVAGRANPGRYLSMHAPARPRRLPALRGQPLRSDLGQLRSTGCPPITAAPWRAPGRQSRRHARYSRHRTRGIPRLAAGTTPGCGRRVKPSPHTRVEKWGYPAWSRAVRLAPDPRSILRSAKSSPSVCGSSSRRGSVGVGRAPATVAYASRRPRTPSGQPWFRRSASLQAPALSTVRPRRCRSEPDGLIGCGAGARGGGRRPTQRRSRCRIGAVRAARLPCTALSELCARVDRRIAAPMLARAPRSGRCFPSCHGLYVRQVIRLEAADAGVVLPGAPGVPGDVLQRRPACAARG